MKTTELNLKGTRFIGGRMPSSGLTEGRFQGPHLSIQLSFGEFSKMHSHVESNVPAVKVTPNIHEDHRMETGLCGVFNKHLLFSFERCQQ